MRVATNLQSMTALRELGRTTRDIEKSQMSLSSGDRISRAAYDPAGLAISEKMKSKIRGNGQLKRNVNDGISLLQVAEGSLGVIGDLTIRLRELAMQAASDTIANTERVMADSEFQQLKIEISRLAKSTTFNGNHVLKDSGSVYDIQVGLNNIPGLDQITYNMQKALGPVNNIRSSSINIRNKNEAQGSLSKLDRIMEKVNEGRSNLGSVGNRMKSVMQNLLSSNENLTQSNSKIRDTEIASESTNKAILDIRNNATTALLAQANSRPDAILKLIN